MRHETNPAIIAMPSVSEIQLAILELAQDDYAQLREWLSELDWERWDTRIEDDSAAGRLDFLFGEAAELAKSNALGSLEDRSIA